MLIRPPAAARYLNASLAASEQHHERHASLTPATVAVPILTPLVQKVVPKLNCSVSPISPGLLRIGRPMLMTIGSDRRLPVQRNAGGGAQIAERKCLRCHTRTRTAVIAEGMVVHVEHVADVEVPRQPRGAVVFHEWRGENQFRRTHRLQVAAERLPATSLPSPTCIPA